MLKKKLSIALVAMFSGACASAQAQQHEENSLAADKSRIVGIWAMKPLRNGIANVAEYREDGQVLLHPFTCADAGKQEPEVSSYTVAADGKSIHIKSPEEAFDLQVVAFSPPTMRLGMRTSDQNLTFLYEKVSTVAPLCSGWNKSLNPKARNTAYAPGDFVPAPMVPTHKDIDRYIGKWADGNGRIEIEVVRDPSGYVYLYHAADKNWNYLYNDVRWVGDVLFFQGYGYSDKPELFGHSFHKSPTAMSLQLTAEGKMRNSILGGLFNFELTRIKDGADQ